MRLLLTQLDADPGVGLDNLGQVERMLPTDVSHDDVLLLPELFGGEIETAAYEQHLGEFAARVGCHVVGGSHHAPAGGELTNAGTIVGPSGAVIDRYGKRRPYGSEQETVTADHATGAGRFHIAGREVVVVVCADFWFSEFLHGLDTSPDVVLVPAFSVSQKPSPDHARSLWTHMTASRAYEFSAFIGVSDWAHPVAWDGLPSSGVAGFADPNPTLDRVHFDPAGDAGVMIVDPDFARLDELRLNRIERGFDPMRSPNPEMPQGIVTDRLQGAP